MGAETTLTSSEARALAEAGLSLLPLPQRVCLAWYALPEGHLGAYGEPRAPVDFCLLEGRSGGTRRDGRP